jgi:hypothetical protein
VSGHALQVTRHARARSAQRSIREQQIGLIIQLGRRFHKAGAIFCFFGEREAKRNAHLAPHVVDGITGCVVVLARADQTVLTVYRNSNAPRQIRRKRDWDEPRYRRVAATVTEA